MELLWAAAKLLPMSRAMPSHLASSISPFIQGSKLKAVNRVEARLGKDRRTDSNEAAPFSIVECNVVVICPPEQFHDHVYKLTTSHCVEYPGIL